MKTQKLSFEALKERAEAVASNELLKGITGGTEDACNSTGILDIDAKHGPTPTTVNPGRLR